MDRRSVLDPPTDTLVRLAELVLHLNCFEFDGCFFQQVRGVSMGTKFGPTYACICMGFKRWWRELRAICVGFKVVPFKTHTNTAIHYQNLLKPMHSTADRHRPERDSHGLAIS